MNIKSKILFSTSMILALVVLVILGTVLFILDRGIREQSDVLIEDLYVQSEQRIISGEKILQDGIDSYVREIEFEILTLCWCKYRNNFWLKFRVFSRLRQFKHLT